MSGMNSKKLEVMRRREAVSARYLSGQTMRQVAEALEISLATVQRDLAALDLQWEENAASNTNRHKARLLAKNENLERLAHQAFMASIGEVIVTTHRGKGKATASPTHCPKCSHPLFGAPSCSKCKFVIPTAGTEVTRQEIKRKSYGDPRYLKIIDSCLNRYGRLHGLEVTTPASGYEHLPVIGFEMIQSDDTQEEPEVLQIESETSENGGIADGGQQSPSA